MHSAHERAVQPRALQRSTIEPLSVSGTSMQSTLKLLFEAPDEFLLNFTEILTIPVSSAVAVSVSSHLQP